MRVSQLAEGYTAVLCAAPSCEAEHSAGATAMLSDCVRSSRHGVLVVSGCSLGPVSCRLRPAGPVVLVQPCDAERRPTAPAVRVGPILRDDDLTAVREWISAGRFDPRLLPPHLVALHRGTRAAMSN